MKKEYAEKFKQRGVVKIGHEVIKLLEELKEEMKSMDE